MSCAAGRAVVTEGRTVVTDANADEEGVFVLCGLPVRTRLQLAAMSPGYLVHDATLEIRAGEIGEWTPTPAKQVHDELHARCLEAVGRVVRLRDYFKSIGKSLALGQVITPDAALVTDATVRISQGGQSVLLRYHPERRLYRAKASLLPVLADRWRARLN